MNSLQLVQETACKLNPKPCKKVTNMFSNSYMYPYKGGENHTVTYAFGGVLLVNLHDRPIYVSPMACNTAFQFTLQQFRNLLQITALAQ